MSKSNRSSSRGNEIKRKQPGDLRVIPLGGLGEIGKNMMLIEYETEQSLDSIIIDAGIMFPENDMLGIDYIIPDFRYILDRLDSIRAVIITHGHEDHTGAITHVMEKVNAPIYATPLTRGLLEIKLKNARMLDQVEMVTVQAGDAVQIGPFGVEFFHVCHSIPDSVGLGITTPVGLLVHSGDFKFDHTPVDGWPPDFSKLAEFSQRGVLALFSDSTNADVPGWTPSETVVDAAFDQVFRQAKGRIIVATFASLMSRVQQVFNVALRYGRKVAIAGFSMAENIRIARSLGYLDIPEAVLVDLSEAVGMPSSEVVVLVTGAQGEPSAVLGRIAAGQHKQLQVEPDDTIIIAAHSIPGNEEIVHRTINKLIQRGADVIYAPIAPVHVSGHAAQEELKLLINLVRPRFFVPIHGELRHLHIHSKLAASLGIPQDNIAVVENGWILHFTPDTMTIGERVPGGYVFVDGSGVGDVGPMVMRERELLGRDGFVIANLTLDRDTRKLIGEPEIISRGFVYLRDAKELMANAQNAICNVLNSNGHTSAIGIRRELEQMLERYFYSETKRHPMVFVFVNMV